MSERNFSLFRSLISGYVARKRARSTERLLNSLPEHTRKDIGWPSGRG